MKRFRLFLFLMCFCVWGNYAHAEVVEKVPEDVYEWVQSTARQSYYFNKQQMHYGIDDEGFVDDKVLFVPVIHIYDPIQVQDVQAKRRWNMLSMKGYEKLVGSADYLLIDYRQKQVTFTRHDDLDNEWGTISSVTSSEPISFSHLSDKDVDMIFYTAISNYAKAHDVALLKRTKGKLRPEAQARIDRAEAARNGDNKEVEEKKEDKASKKDKKRDKKSKKDKVKKEQKDNR